MAKMYSAEKSTQILVSLLKAHGIKKAVLSPGMKNYCFVASLQCDDYFELYSCVDERSAAYMACGLAEESGEPVVLSCTGATASRNYISALTEAYYRKLPVLAVTSMTHVGEIGQLIPQIVDRRNQMNDIVKMSVQIPMIHNEKDEWSNNVLLNSALLELRRNGGGPVHINLETECSRDFSVTMLPDFRVIRRVGYADAFPSIKDSKVAIFVGAHAPWSESLTNSVDRFCEQYNGVVICDQTSNYKGKYGVYPSLVLTQEHYQSSLRSIPLMIHIGEISGAYMKVRPSVVWRVNPDGEVRDTFKKLQYVFEMEEEDFFKKWIDPQKTDRCVDYYNAWDEECRKIRSKISDLPFSNGWIASVVLPRLSKEVVLHLAILNSLRMWNMYDGSNVERCYSNTGGFGIDGIASTMIGAALATRDKTHIAVMGDLAFFYDLNSLGNRHVPSNVRILLVNNGRGIEFRNYGHPAAEFGEDADPYMAAAGHYGEQSPELVKHYAQDLGFRYLSAGNKEEFLSAVDVFLDNKTEGPIVFEVFTTTEDESNSYKILRNLEYSTKTSLKQTIKGVLGDKGTRSLKKLVHK